MNISRRKRKQSKLTLYPWAIVVAIVGIGGAIPLFFPPLFLLVWLGESDLWSNDHWGMGSGFMLQRNKVSAVVRVITNSENDELAASAAAAEDAEDGRAI